MKQKNKHQIGVKTEEEITDLHPSFSLQQGGVSLPMHQILQMPQRPRVYTSSWGKELFQQLQSAHLQPSIDTSSSFSIIFISYIFTHPPSRTTKPLSCIQARLTMTKTLPPTQTATVGGYFKDDDEDEDELLLDEEGKVEKQQKQDTDEQENNESSVEPNSNTTANTTTTTYHSCDWTHNQLIQYFTYVQSVRVDLKEQNGSTTPTTSHSTGTHEQSLSCFNSIKY
eukprot:scaffold41757_cov47-Cyclotella_meneghiniana.AAC.4